MRDPTGHFPDEVEEWAEVEALGVDGAAALMREHAAAERPEKASRFRGVTKGKLVDHKGRKTKPWVAQIGVTVDGSKRGRQQAEKHRHRHLRLGGGCRPRLRPQLHHQVRPC